jgi:hypothetical protein
MAANMVPERPDASRRASLALELRALRLRDRELRLERAVLALRARGRAYPNAEPPAPLAYAIADFERQLTEVRRSLARAR